MLGSKFVTWRGPIRHLAFAATVTVTGVTALPAAADAALVEPISVSTTADVPAGQTRSVTLRCPARAVALNTGVTAGLDIVDSVPKFTARGWTLKFTAGSRSRSVSAALRCVRFDMPHGVAGVSLAVETRIEPVVDLAPGATQTLKASCSHGFTPTGWGLDRAGNDLQIRTVKPAKRGWRFAVRNDGTAPATGTAYGRCLERQQHAETGQRHSFAMRSTSAGSCRSSEFSVSTGVSELPNDNIFLTGTGPTGQRGAVWRFANAPEGGPVRTSLVCLSTATGFQ
jgi:hypothetical protein